MRFLAAWVLGSGLVISSAGAQPAESPTRAEAMPAPHTALRWKPASFRWIYSTAHEPEWLAPGAGLALFRRAAEHWKHCGVNIEFAGETAQGPQTPDGVNVLGWAASMAPGLRGITRRRNRGPELVEADILIAAGNPEFRSAPELLSKVITHEFGHALGLVHSPDCRDVMSFGANCRGIPPERLPQQPTQGDLAQCRVRYVE